MAGDVDEAGQWRTFGQGCIAVAEIDGHAALALFLAMVTRLPGQGVQQRGLAVVDMAGGANDHCTGPSCRAGSCANHWASSSS
ncbi:hypothetical protein D3C80_2073530 [compost metagenome]